MKSHRFLFLTLLSGAILFASCSSSDDDPHPTPDPGPDPKPPVEEPETITFSTTSGTYCYMEDYAEIILKSKNDEEVYFRIFSEELPNGKFELATNKAAKTIMGGKADGSSYYKTGGTTLYFATGSANIQLTEEFKLTISGELEFSNKDILKISGQAVEIEDITPVNNIVFTADTGNYDQFDNYFEIRLENEAGDEALIFLYYQTGFSGTYVINSTRDKGTIAAEESWVKTADGEIYPLVSGDIKVKFEKGDDIIVSFEGIANTTKEKGIEFDFSEIFLPRITFVEYVYGEIMYYWRLDNRNGFLFLYLKNGFGTAFDKSLSFYVTTIEQTDRNNIHLPAGTYKAGNGTGEAFTYNARTERYYSFWYIIEDSTMHPYSVESGEFTVEKTGGFYTIEGTVMDNRNYGLKISVSSVEFVVEDYSENSDWT